MNNLIEQAKIDEAIVRFPGSSLSNDSLHEITDLYGQDIASKVKTIYDEALDCPIDWKTATMDSALDVMHDLLDAKYSWLTKEARSKLNDAFIMAWN